MSYSIFENGGYIGTEKSYGANGVWTTHSQMPRRGGLIGANSGTLTGIWNIRDLPSVSFAYLQTSSDNDNTAVTSKTFSAVNFGADIANRYVIITLGVFRQAALSSITIGGETATMIGSEANADGASEFYSIWYAQPSGTSGDIVVTLASSATLQLAISTYRFISNDIATSQFGASSNNSGGTTAISLTAVGPGSLILWSGGNANQSAGTPTFTNITGVQDDVRDVRSNEWMNACSGTADAAGSAQISHNGSEGAVMALWDLP